jgi:hypothetical protein
VVAALDENGAEYVAHELSSGVERWRAPTTGVQPQLIDGTSLRRAGLGADATDRPYTLA